MNDESPACHLGAHIEELRNNTLTVVLQRQKLANRSDDSFLQPLVTHHRHLRQFYEQQQHNTYSTDEDIRLDKNVQVMVLHQFILRIRQLNTLCRIHRIHLRLNIVHCHDHAHQRTNRIECLGKVKSLSSSIFSSHTIDKRVTARLKESHTTCQQKISYEEWEIDSSHLCWQKHQRTYSEQRHAQHHSCLERIALNEQCGRERHREIAKIISHLNH